MSTATFGLALKSSNHSPALSRTATGSGIISVTNTVPGATVFTTTGVGVAVGVGLGDGVGVAVAAAGVGSGMGDGVNAVPIVLVRSNE